MAQLCEACLKGDFGAARQIHTRYLPLMDVNFVESSPGPVKAAMAMMGLLEPNYRLPVVGPRTESRAKIEKVLQKLGLLAPIAASAD
jgi:4-hydroxy-tetrahydrodipicolinate synthase